MDSVATRFENLRIEYASFTPRPRIRSTTIRTLRGDMPTFLAIARACMVDFSCARLAGFGALVELTTVTAERPRRRKLAQLVPDHILRQIDGNELVSIVYGQRVANELGRNGRAA